MKYYRLKDLYDDYPVDSDDWIYLCHQGACRTFRAVQSVEDVAELIENTPEFNRCYYEVVPPNRPCRVYYDFDHVVSDVDNVDVTRLTDALINAVKQCILTNAKNRGYPIEEDQLFFTVSPGERKVSVHLVISGVRVAKTSHAHHVAMALLASLPEQFHDYVDRSVYKSNQQFRLLECHKYLTERTKRPWSGNRLRFNDLVDALNVTMISVVKRSDYVIDADDIVPKRLDQTLEALDVDDELVSACLWFLNDPTLTVRDVSGSMIILNRTAPSQCPNCHRVHNHENPFLTVSNRGVYFHCRRSPSSTRLGDADWIVDFYRSRSNDDVTSSAMSGTTTGKSLTGSSGGGLVLDESTNGFDLSLDTLDRLVDKYCPQ